MRILFLDQSGKPGGAELSLLDVARPYRDRCLVALFEDGPYRDRLEQAEIPVTCLSQRGLQVNKGSSWWQGLRSLGDLWPLLWHCIGLSRQYDLIYANTSKAFVVGALASWLSGRPLVYHLRDIFSAEHFSASNLSIAISLANRCANLVIANSHATRDAFIAAGGRAELCQVVYNGFEPAAYEVEPSCRSGLRQALGLREDNFVVGHFSRLSPWKGQHVLLEALVNCPEPVVVLLVGAALFGEEAYVAQLRQQVISLGLEHRVQFLGFRSDTAELMATCDLITHTSIAAEPFGRVIVEAMLARRPIIGAAAGGVLELIEPGQTGWLVSPGDAVALAKVMTDCWSDRPQLQRIADQAYAVAQERFHLSRTQEQLHSLLVDQFALADQTSGLEAAAAKASSL